MTVLVQTCDTVPVAPASAWGPTGTGPEALPVVRTEVTVLPALAAVAVKLIVIVDPIAALLTVKRSEVSPPLKLSPPPVTVPDAQVRVMSANAGAAANCASNITSSSQNPPVKNLHEENRNNPLAL